MPKPIKALIFDVGGVLVRTQDLAPRRKLAAELGLSLREIYQVVFGSETWDQAQLGRIVAADHWEAVGQHLGLTWPDGTNAFRAAFFAGDRLDRDLIALISQLRGRYKTALLSNNPSSLRQSLAIEWRIPADTFDVIVISAEEGVMKPDPEIFRIALARLNVAPHEAIFVDDFVENVEGARSLGIEAIHFTSPEALMTELASRIDLFD